ncbi:hypothetical protein CO661_14035 [Sinorhizobium fredii]|uniref:Uncharacterized protein n=1 Tax=Rhizobium fredii TaxID=380 RepID=A0A2A6LY89_RHIFR|nr:hypothetical protein [Sinorhizobium fredii]PDT47297.1 hypothetical protein CO661_14035 [Sinorhizobium fredii]
MSVTQSDLDKAEAITRELWAAKSLDLYMCDGTVRADQFGLLGDIRKLLMGFNANARSDWRNAVIEALEECEEYFDNRADAEYFTDDPSPVPNEEMRLLTVVLDALKKARAR